MTQETNESSVFTGALGRARIIKAADATAILEATDIVQQAHTEADRIGRQAQQASRSSTLNAKREAADIIAEAKKTAAQLVEEAKLQASDQKEKILQEQQKLGEEKVAKELLKRVSAAYAELDNAEGAIIQLIEAALRQILGKFDHVELIASTVRKGIMDLHEQWGLTLRVHPSNLETVKAAISLIQKSENDGPIQSIETSNTVKPEDCFIVCSIGLVDVSLEAQLQRILEEIRVLGERGDSA